MNNCPIVTACTLRPTVIDTNADLIEALIQAQEDYAFCAAKVDMIIDCQGNGRVKSQ